MSCFNCLKKCKMTSQLRESKYCNQEAEITEDGIVFGCSKLIHNEDQSLKNFLTCMYYELELYDKCNTCPLDCPKNKNPELEAFKKKKERVDKILNSINNFGINTSNTIKISNMHKKNKTLSEDALTMLSLSSNLLNKGVAGKGYDISHFQCLMKNLIKKMRR